MIEICALHIEKNLDIQQFESLLLLVSEEKRNRILKNVRFEDAQRSLLADVLARFMLCRSLNLSNEDITFYYNSFGKPFLKNVENVFFNVSHSGNWVVCALDNSPIGIDIEIVKPIDISIARRFFSTVEYKDIMKRTPTQREDYFYTLWTLKESYIKAIGKGLSIPLDSFSFRVKNDMKDPNGNIVAVIG
ncbi:MULTISPECIES: 4'-phosphopantetheinyl transferase family protein [Paenibacillus]|jgi:phosphopantethiene--protein transferase domain|nr:MULTISPECIES: 4'-phosphopantetheinyl transferase superfamily protein [Paenibacillus]